jgi:opacity protein-like surface antigen
MLGCGMLLPSAPAAADADSAAGTSAPSFEISPFAGYRVGGSFHDVDSNQSVSLDAHASFALALDARADEGSQYEFFYSRQSSVLSGSGFAPVDTTIQYLHIGGTVMLDQSQPRVQPYLAGGLGVTLLEPDSPGAHDDTRFSASLALGLRVPLSRNFQLRFEGRGYLTLMTSDAAIFCGSNQNGALCQIHAQGSTFFQFDFLAGVSFVF